MPELGGLYEIADVKGLILFLLKEADCILEETQMTDILMEDGLVEYFDYKQAMEQLLMTGLIDIASMEEAGSYRITEQGREVEMEYEKEIPYNVRSKTQQALKKNLRRQKENDQIFTEITPSPSGYSVCCNVREGGETMLSYEVLVPDQRTAYYAAERFRKNPSLYYQKIMEIVLDEELFKKNED